MFFSFEKHLIISFATSPYMRFTVIISEAVSSACWGFTLQLISCATLKKPPKTCLICLDNSMTGIRLKACNCNKADSFTGPLAGCLLAQVRRAIPKLSPVCISVLMIHPSPIMCLWLEFANIATHSQLLTLLFRLWLCLLIWAIPRTVRVQYFQTKPWTHGSNCCASIDWLLHYAEWVRLSALCPFLSIRYLTGK